MTVDNYLTILPFCLFCHLNTTYLTKKNYKIYTCIEFSTEASAVLRSPKPNNVVKANKNLYCTAFFKFAQNLFVRQKIT